MAVKVDIISGFLGAGKTTLIKKLLAERLFDEQVVLIENEFGEIGIDSGILKSAGIEIREINAGCICCTLVGDFGAALREVIRKFSPDRVIIEPSGVGKLSDILRVCDKFGDGIRVNITAVVVDAVKYKMYAKNFSEFFGDQIQHAKTIVLSRTQKLTPERLSEVVGAIREKNPQANMITTPWDTLPAQTILAAAEQDAESSLAAQIAREAFAACGHGCGHDHTHGEKCSCGHEHTAPEVFESWGIETPKVFIRQELDQILRTLANSQNYGNLLRAKGILAVEEGAWIQFDFVPGELETREIAPDYTGRLCVIGTRLDRAALASLFGV